MIRSMRGCKWSACLPALLVGGLLFVLAGCGAQGEDEETTDDGPQRSPVVLRAIADQAAEDSGLDPLLTPADLDEPELVALNGETVADMAFVERQVELDVMSGNGPLVPPVTVNCPLDTTPGPGTLTLEGSVEVISLSATQFQIVAEDLDLTFFNCRPLSTSPHVYWGSVRLNVDTTVTFIDDADEDPATEFPHQWIFEWDEYFDGGLAVAANSGDNFVFIIRNTFQGLDDTDEINNNGDTVYNSFSYLLQALMDEIECNVEVSASDGSAPPDPLPWSCSP